ncbi:unnamed protein product [Trichobilharzia regenti]|nr:unnamed protein product [Trichobilharzia regenti]
MNICNISEWPEFRSSKFSIVFAILKLIARYELNRSMDKYNGHRISQLIEVMEFIRMTSTGSDAIIISGDFNLESDTLAIELFRTSLKLSDAWLNNNSCHTVKKLIVNRENLSKRCSVNKYTKKVIQDKSHKIMRILRR